MPDLAVQLGRLSLKNPILVASGTFGYAREMAAFVPFDKLGGIIPKTVTPQPRAGNPPPRTVETASGMLNAIGLDNDGIGYFIEKHVPYLTALGPAVIANIAGHNASEFIEMARLLANVPGLAGVELNISCPNVSGGTDFGVDPRKTREIVAGVRKVCPLPIIAKLTPNVTDIREVAWGALNGGADAVSISNTVLGIVIDWKKRKPILGNGVGGLSGPAIKPIVLRMVMQVAREVPIPIIGVGGIQTIDGVMEFLVAGASAVQIGTANFYNPTFAATAVDELDRALTEAGCASVREIVGTLRMPGDKPCAPESQLPRH